MRDPTPPFASGLVGLVQAMFTVARCPQDRLRWAQVGGQPRPAQDFGVWGHLCICSACGKRGEVGHPEWEGLGHSSPFFPFCRRNTSRREGPHSLLVGGLQRRHMYVSHPFFPQLLPQFPHRRLGEGKRLRVPFECIFMLHHVLLPSGSFSQCLCCV